MPILSLLFNWLILGICRLSSQHCNIWLWARKKDTNVKTNVEGGQGWPREMVGLCRSRHGDHAAPLFEPCLLAIYSSYLAIDDFAHSSAWRNVFLARMDLGAKNMVKRMTQSTWLGVDAQFGLQHLSSGSQR
jgi:hypothetical protein